MRLLSNRLVQFSLVAAALDSGRHAVVEAGTGIGKTFAYLLPVLLDLGVAAKDAEVMLAGTPMYFAPEVAAQFTALVNGSSGVSDAQIESAFPIDGAQLAEVVASLEKRFARKLNASVTVVPELIGGIRVTVGDEVLDTSVKARLEQMKLALTA